MDDGSRNTFKIMEDQTAFDLNLAVQRWREELARSSAFRTENLNELESHLRDSFDRLRTRELSDEEVFLIATRRLGNAQKLEREFGKMNNAAVGFDRFLWIFVAILLWFLVSSTSIALIIKTPSTPRNIRTAKTPSVSNVPARYVSSWPRPCCEAMISPAITPSNA